MQVHVQNQNGEAKFWLEPAIELTTDAGLYRREIAEALRLIISTGRNSTLIWPSSRFVIQIAFRWSVGSALDRAQRVRSAPLRKLPHSPTDPPRSASQRRINGTRSRHSRRASGANVVANRSAAASSPQGQLAVLRSFAR